MNLLAEWTRNSSVVTATAFIYALTIPALGYIFLGQLVAMLFLIGYLAGFIAWQWRSTRPAYSAIRAPYLLTLAAFLLLHKPEENINDFFQVLSNKITSVPVPEVSIFLVFSLLVLPLVPWLIAPILIKRGNALGYFFAWTLFASMGITELAHFVFPLMTSEPYGYFPGMASVLVLAPLAWWGMFRLLRPLRSN